MHYEHDDHDDHLDQDDHLDYDDHLDPDDHLDHDDHIENDDPPIRKEVGGCTQGSWRLSDQMRIAASIAQIDNHYSLTHSDMLDLLDM